MCQTLTPINPEQVAAGPTKARPLRIVSVFNRYALRGGEEEVFEAEAEMLTSRGCQVNAISTKTVRPEGPFAKAALGLQTPWSPDWPRRISELLAKDSPDLLHVRKS